MLFPNSGNVEMGSFGISKTEFWPAESLLLELDRSNGILCFLKWSLAMARASCFSDKESSLCCGADRNKVFLGKRELCKDGGSS